MSPIGSTEIAVGVGAPSRPPLGGMPWGQSSHLVQELWFAVVGHEWRSLAVVPVAPGSSGLEVANALGEVGGIHRRVPMVVLDARQIELKQVSAMLDVLASVSKPGERTLVALDSPLANRSGVLLARAADKVLLVTELGKADLASARKVLELVGREKVLGSVVLRGDGS